MYDVTTRIIIEYGFDTTGQAPLSRGYRAEKPVFKPNTGYSLTNVRSKQGVDFKWLPAGRNHSE